MTDATRSLPLWRCEPWGDGSSAPGTTNILCPEYEIVVATGIEIGEAILIVLAHNAAIRALATPAHGQGGPDER